MNCINLDQWFLTFFVLWTPKSQKKNPWTPKVSIMPFVEPLILEKEA
jgi:hypothetical protein